MYDKKTIKRFWDKVNKTDGCWEWLGYFKTDKRFKGGKTYGFFSFGKNRNLRAHRVSWEIHFGEIPKGMCVCHHCDNPICVRPDHLFLGTMYDNNMDAVKKGRIKILPFKLTTDQVQEIRKLYSTRDFIQKELGKKFNVSQTTIKDVVNYKTWKYI